MTIYKQYDSRWSRKNYNGSSSIGTAACGPFSVANVIVEHKSINPMDVVKFMQKNGYAIRNRGTAWDGIPAAMKHFGMKDVKAVNVSKSMSKVWEYMKKGYDAVFLFSAGSRGGVCWTTQGHYVAMVGYKVKNGKHYLKAKDSGGRDHDGWYCYETQMKGLIPQVWVGKMDGSKPEPTPKPDAKYTGKLPALPKRGYFLPGDKGDNVGLLQKFLIWAGFSVGKAGADKIYGNATKNAVKQFEQAYGLSPDGKWGNKCQTKAKTMCK